MLRSIVVAFFVLISAGLPTLIAVGCTRAAPERTTSVSERSSAPDGGVCDGDTTDGSSTARAQAAWDALVANFGPQVLQESAPGKYPQDIFVSSVSDAGPVPAYLWTQDQIGRAALDLEKVTNNDYSATSWPVRVLDTIPEYFVEKNGVFGCDPAAMLIPPSLRYKDTQWWDECGWAAHVLLQGQVQIPNSCPPNGACPPTYLQHVQALWPFMQQGQAQPSQPCMGPPCLGGEWENDLLGATGTVSSGSIDDALELLYLLGPVSDPNRSAYLTLAYQNDAWMKGTLLDPSAKLYWDHYCPDILAASCGWHWCSGTKTDAGTCVGGSWLACNPNRADLPSPPPPPPSNNICQWMFGASTGFMIGSDIRRYLIEGPTPKGNSYLANAVATANAQLAYSSQLVDGGPENYEWLASPIDRANLFVNLLVLDYYAPNPAYRAALQAYLDDAWQNARDCSTGLFTQGRIGDGKSYTALDQAAWVIMYSILDWPHDSLPNLY
jgi:hypothetical protein